jgi:AcrR family transcriptional regulator
MAQGRRESLTAGDWTEAALEALAGGGLAAVAVEPIAKSLGATKGSFYWHFADRNALLSSALDLWEARDTDRVIAGLDETQDPSSRLRTLLRLTFLAVVHDTSPRRGAVGAVELALQASASHPLVAATLTRVTQRRLAFLTGLYAELGLPRARARDQALLAYTAFLGHAQLAHATPALLPKGRALRTHVEQVVEALASPSGAAG